MSEELIPTHAWVDDDGTEWVAMDDHPEGDPHVEYKEQGKNFWENESSYEVAGCVTEILKLRARIAELEGEVERLKIDREALIAEAQRDALEEAAALARFVHVDYSVPSADWILASPMLRSSVDSAAVSEAILSGAWWNHPTFIEFREREAEALNPRNLTLTPDGELLPSEVKE